MPDLLAHINRVDDADDRGIHRTIFTALRHTGGTALHDQDNFTNASADRVDGDDMAFLILSLFVNQTRHQKLAPEQALIFTRRDYGANDSR